MLEHTPGEELDAGAVVAQSEVPVLPDDSEAELEQRVLEAEHELYPRALAAFVLQARS